MQHPGKTDHGQRRFGCTACGQCCNSGPELELGETIALADRFVMALLFKVHSLPAGERSTWAPGWWREEKSRIPLRAALEEKRRHLGTFTSRRSVENHRERHRHLTISAMAHDFGQHRCPQLMNGLCAIHPNRPLSCRSVPLHYSRPPSVLAGYVDAFVATPGYRCDTTPSAPEILDGRKIVDPEIARARDAAITQAKADRSWKDKLLALMDDPEAAAEAELPTASAVLDHSDNGYATSLPILVAWRVLRDAGMMPTELFETVCRQQLALIRGKLSVCDDPALAKELLDMRAAYNRQLSVLRSPAPAGYKHPMPRQG